MSINKLQPEINKIYYLEPKNPFDKYYAKVLDIKNGYVKYEYNSSGITGSMTIEKFREIYMTKELGEFEVEKYLNKETSHKKSLFIRFINYLES